MEDRAVQNARIVLQASCHAQAGETLLLVVANDSLAQRIPALVAAARELGLVATIMDIRPFVSDRAYAEGRVLEPVRNAILAADIVIANIEHLHNAARPDFSRLLGDPDANDRSLTAERRWVYLTCNGMQDWQISVEQVRRMIARTGWLVNLLRSAQQGHITTALGTDLTFGLGAGASMTPVLGIVPLYAEVAVVPVPWSCSGVFVVDGPTQLDVRPKTETGQAPLRITVEAGRVVDVKGDPTQLQRLQRFIASGDPPPETIDEVGLLTTPFADNDLYEWPDGTHHHDCAHVALGNNERRDQVVHGPKHMDGELRRPTIRIDGQTIIENGVFLDEVMQ